ncbi:Uncharacterized protein HZ326_20347 [Fusarium oxysporum f. sp. albedinis]|nr:Uncharacterized protein HZ326_20347 [Fusarium oxysporum f. sp. albedinis]
MEREHIQESKQFQRAKMPKDTYNSGDSLVVTDPTTNPPVSGLTMGERTGSRIFHYLWSYVLENGEFTSYNHKSPQRFSVPFDGSVDYQTSIIGILMTYQNSREESCRSIKTGKISHLYYYIKFHGLLSELPLINVELGSLFAVSALFLVRNGNPSISLCSNLQHPAVSRRQNRIRNLHQITDLYFK